MYDLRGKHRVKNLIELLNKLDPDDFVWITLFDGDPDICVGRPWDKLESILIPEVHDYVFDDEDELRELEQDWSEVT